MSRPRINLNMICSTEDYHASKKRHQSYIQREHINNKSIIDEIMPTLKKEAYTRVFGKLIHLTPAEAHRLENSVSIIYL
jgi:hypothetical protein